MDQNAWIWAYYEQGLYTDEYIQFLVDCGILTQEEWAQHQKA